MTHSIFGIKMVPDQIKSFTEMYLGDLMRQCSLFYWSQLAEEGSYAAENNSRGHAPVVLPMFQGVLHEVDCHASGSRGSIHKIVLECLAYGLTAARHRIVRSLTRGNSLLFIQKIKHLM